MKPNKKQLREGLADNISSSLLYAFFVDLYPLVNKKGGLSTIMFPNVGMKKLSRWVEAIAGSEAYTKNEEALKAVFMRLGASSSLKTLYRAVNTLKSKQTNSSDNEQRISDLELLVSKIGRVIKSKLTQEERSIFSQLSSELDTAADNAAKSIEGSVGASTVTPAPEEEPAAEPKQEPAAENPEQPAEEPVPTEKPEAPAPEEKPAAPAAPATPPAQKPAAPKAAPQKPEEAPPAEEKPAEAPPTETPEKGEETSGEEAEEQPKKESVMPHPYSITAEQRSISEDYLRALIREIVMRKLKLK